MPSPRFRPGLSMRALPSPPLPEMPDFSFGGRIRARRGAPAGTPSQLLLRSLSRRTRHPLPRKVSGDARASQAGQHHLQGLKKHHSRPSQGHPGHSSREHPRSRRSDFETGLSSSTARIQCRHRSRSDITEAPQRGLAEIRLERPWSSCGNQKPRNLIGSSFRSSFRELLPKRVTDSYEATFNDACSCRFFRALRGDAFSPLDFGERSGVCERRHSDGSRLGGFSKSSTPRLLLLELRSPYSAGPASH